MSAPRRTRIVVFTLLVLAAIVLFLFLSRDQLSTTLAQGPLASVHAELDVEARCNDCHVERRRLDDDLCLKCHEPIQERIGRRSGYHAKVEGTCASCHADHVGRDASLIRWPSPEAPFKRAGLVAGDQAKFPHGEATGFALEGAHAPLSCEQCHKASLIVDQAVVDFVKGHTTFLGLGKDCASCHQDAHAPSMGKDCARCHDAAAWTPAPRFAHQETRFPLAGKHAQVKCDACHLQPPGPLPPAAAPPRPGFVALAAKAAPRPFRGAGFGKAPARTSSGDALPECLACHANPHRTGEGFERCEACHTPHDWKNQGQVAQASTFDHAKTGFVLDGAHGKVTCTKCHGPKLDTAARRSCAECHEDTKHKGGFDREMAIARKGCDLCHSTAAWKPDTYAEEKHPLPLIERHAVECEKCHAKEAKFPRLPARPPAELGPLDESCKACHVDVHKGKLSQDCASCHGFKTFHLAQLSVEGHAELGFPIREAHLKVTCEGCHGGRAAEGGLRRLALADARTQGCVACHVDAHRGQLTTQCATCHTEAHFTPSTFDEARHQKTRFPLQGGHRAVPCEACHVKDLPPDPPAQRFHWEGRSQRCDQCHRTDDPHKGQFAGTDCAQCHAQEAWIPSKFDKDAHAKLGVPLVAGHDRACNTCHVPRKGGGPVVFRGTPEACAACHLDNHAGQFATRGGQLGCERCHDLATWKDHHFDHDAPPSRFPLTGRHAQVACTACHLVTTRQVPGGGQQKVTHYFPIEERACDDCHENPHAAPGGKR